MLPKGHGGRKVYSNEASLLQTVRMRRGAADPPLSFNFSFHLDNGYRANVTNEHAVAAAEATSREFGSVQKVFGRYTLIKVLGLGGMGIVWLALHVVLNCDGASHSL